MSIIPIMSLLKTEKEDDPPPPPPRPATVAPFIPQKPIRRETPRSAQKKDEANHNRTQPVQTKRSPANLPLRNPSQKSTKNVTKDEPLSMISEDDINQVVERSQNAEEFQRQQQGEESDECKFVGGNTSLGSGLDLDDLVSELEPISGDSGIFELLLPNGESLRVAVTTQANHVQFFLSPLGSKIGGRIKEKQVELERRLSRRIGKNVSLTVL